jgi:hypothetical protein
MFGDDGWGATYESAGPVANLLRTGDGGHTWRRVTPQIAQGNFIFGFALIDARDPGQFTAPNLEDAWTCKMLIEPIRRRRPARKTNLQPVRREQ